MARRRNYRRGGFRNRFSGYGKRFKGYYNKSGLQLSTEFLAGTVVGAMTQIDNNIPVQVKVLAACAPVKGFGKIKAFAQGLLIGDVLSAYIPKIGGMGNGNGSTSNEL